MSRNVYLTIDYYDPDSGKATDIVFSIDPDDDSVGRLVGKLEYSVSCRVWVQENSTTYGFAKFTVANNDGLYDFMTDVEMIGYQISDSVDSDYSAAVIQATGLIKRTRVDGEKNLEFTAKDPKEGLNTRIMGDLLPASEASTVSPFATNNYYGRENTPRPWLMNLCYSCSPLLLNRSVNEYQIHDEENWNFSEVMDNGVNVTYTNKADGKLSLAADPTENGVLLVSARGQYMDSGVDFANFYFEVLVEFFQKAGWTATDATNITDLEYKDKISGGTYRPKTAFYISPDSNYTFNQILQWMCDSTTSFNYIDPTGDLLIKYLIKPEDETEDGEITQLETITQIDIIDDIAPKITTRVGVARNWTVMTDEQLAASVSETRSHELTQQWRDVAVATQTLDPFYTDTEETFDSLLTGLSQGEDHINNLVDIYSDKRKFYFVACETFFDIGDVVKVTNERFGIEAGKKLLCLGYTRDYLNNTLSLILWG